MEFKDREIKHIYKWMGHTSQSLKNLDFLYKNLIVEIKEDRKEHKLQIRTLMAEYKAEIEKCKESADLFKYEKKYIYGMLTVLFGIIGFIGKKVFF